jgi:hypothetical protein
MWPLNITFPSGRTVQVVPRHLWLVAAVIASISLFTAYVGLLSGSVERGAAQWRAAQEAGPAPPARAVKGTLGIAPAPAPGPRKRSSVAG